MAGLNYFCINLVKSNFKIVSADYFSNLCIGHKIKPLKEYSYTKYFHN